MEEKQELGSLNAGSTPLIKVIDQSEYMVRIQSTSKPDEYVDVFKNALPMFIKVLQDVDKEVNRR